MLRSPADRGGPAGRTGLGRLTFRVALVLALGWAVAGCRGKTATPPRGAEVRIPDQEARDFTLTESSEGRRVWTLWASYAAMYNDRSLVDARTVKLDFFNDEGAKYSTLVAEEGRVHQRTNDLEARGDVKITTESGVTMETDSLRWINKTGRIVSDAFVRVTRKHDVVTGYGFESDASLERFHIARDVRAEVRAQEQESGAGGR